MGVTGAGGFIGSHLTERLLSLGHSVRALVRYNSRSSTGHLGVIVPELRSRLQIYAGDVTDPHVLGVRFIHGRTRLFQTNGQKDQHQVGADVVLSTTRWDGGRLLTDYDLGNGRKMRIAYSLVPGTRQLLEQVTFENGQVIKRIYDAVATNKR